MKPSAAPTSTAPGRSALGSEGARGRTSDTKNHASAYATAHPSTTVVPIPTPTELRTRFVTIVNKPTAAINPATLPNTRSVYCFGGGGTCHARRLATTSVFASVRPAHAAPKRPTTSATHRPV